MRNLTWYPGTILPHASLWHTLMRVTWLNDLREGEIRKLLPTRGHDASRSLEDLSVVDMRAVADVLGERRGAVTSLSVERLFPTILREGLMEHGLRWCPQCIEAGYHTMLGSILLVTRCPIHGTPLLDACPNCHERLPMRMRRLSAKPPFCRCGQTHFIDSTTARLPSLSREVVEAWDPVYAWVRQVRSVGCSRTVCTKMTLSTRLALVAQWCRDLGIHYPSCFESEDKLWSRVPGERQTWPASYRVYSGDMRGDTKRHPILPTDSSGAQQPHEWVYRSLARHLRRHGLRHPDGWVKVLKRADDAQEFAIQMAAQPKAAVAFTEMLWARHLEPTAIYHRWPNRAEPISREIGMPHYTAVCLNRNIAKTIWSTAVNSRVRDWVEYHAMAMEASQSWGRASRLARSLIENEWSWSGDYRDLRRDVPEDGAIWVCRLKRHAVQFVGYLRGVHSCPFSTTMLTKIERIAKVSKARTAVRDRFESIAQARCLGWNARDGWHVTKGATPDDAGLRRVRLLHCGPPTACWVFRSKMRFFARLEDGGIEASGDTPSDALNGLRRAVVQHRRTYGINGAVHPITSLT